MQTSGRLLFGLCFFLSCCTVRGIRYLPPEAEHFTKCDPSQNQCPANSLCEETRKGYYCACNHKFLNVKEKTTITYPGGECLEFCSARENVSPCACRRGSALTLNDNGLYQCRDTCRNDLDCPSEATCTAGSCYCKVCKPQGNNCVTLVKLDDVCPAPDTTTTPLPTSTTRFTTTRAKPVAPQPAPDTTTTRLPTSTTRFTTTRAKPVAPQPGEIILPPEAAHFPQCDPSLNQCPANSLCLQTNKGYYCSCDPNFLNDNEKIPITYPEGECLEHCSTRGNISPCACRLGSVLSLNQNALYVCTGEILILPPEAAHFPQCNPSQNQCPANSLCLETNEGYYCSCDRNFINDNEKTSITYPGGECLEYCSARGNISPCACGPGYDLRLNQNAHYVCIVRRNTNTTPLLTTHAQPGAVTPRPSGNFLKDFKLMWNVISAFKNEKKGKILILPPRAIDFPQCDPALNQCPANSCCKNTNKGFHCACHTNFYNIKDELTFTYPGGECLEFCEVQGKTFPCACKPGFTAMLNENGHYVCIVNDMCQEPSRR